MSNYNARVRRYAIFFVMEAAFIALAWHCYSQSRALPDYANLVDLQNLKSGFIVIFNLWHAAAIACIIEICHDAFSREWKAIMGKTTDKVSTTTASFLDRSMYALTGRPTRTYRTAFALFLGLILMGTTGPSSIIVTEGVTFAERLDIGVLSTPSFTLNNTNMDNPAFHIQLAEANMVVRLENLLKEPWGYVPQSNYLIPLPAGELGDTQRVEYESDVVGFHHQCRWRAPDHLESNKVILGNETWTGLFTSHPRADVVAIRNGSSILQLLPEGQSPNGTSVFMILGGNMTMHPNTTSSSEAWIDLSDMGAMYNADGFLSPDILNATASIFSPLAILLVCDPALQFMAGTVILDPVANLTAHDVTITPKYSGSPYGIISQSAASTLFSSLLSDTINGPDVGLPGIELVNELDFLNLNAVAAQMLLNLPPPPRQWENTANIQPLDLPMINKNIDDYTLSALKAFTSGYKGDSSIVPIKGTFTKNVGGEGTQTHSALVTSRPYAILHSVLFVVVSLGSAFLAYINERQHREPFTLEALEQHFKEYFKEYFATHREELDEMDNRGSRAEDRKASEP